MFFLGTISTVVMMGISAGPTQANAKEILVPRIAVVIDRELSADWSANGITPAMKADDAEFARRAYLDFLGRIPKVAEVREFQDDKTANKRELLVKQLLNKPAASVHLASFLRSAWLPESLTDMQAMYQGQMYEGYLRKQLALNKPLSEIVAKTLTANINVGQRGQLRGNYQYDADTQALYGFYYAVQAKPENLGSTVSRAMLGVKLECAQCHDHPFASYTRDQFWEFAAFFAEFTPLPPIGPNFVGPLKPQFESNQLPIPNTNRFASAKHFDGTEPEWGTKSARQELVDWIVNPKNDYFSKNMTNRYWGQLFGVGLIDPIDEPGPNNPPSHPALLKELSKLFIEADFDVRILLRGMAASKAYQLTSKLSHPSQADARKFARMNVKGLGPNQIYDSFVAATGLRNPENRNMYYGYNNGQGRGMLASLFPMPAKPIETQTSILQALTMMNNKLIADQTNLEKSEMLAAVIDAPFMDTEKKIDTLFMAALTRTPTVEEREKLASYVDRGGPSGDSKKALSDVFWVLLNSPEFMFNH